MGDQAAAIVESVSIEATASASQLEAVREAFLRAGFDVDVQADWERRSADVLPWLVSVGLGIPIETFFVNFAKSAGSAAGEQAGKDGYASFKTWFRDLLEARRTTDSGGGEVVLRDPDATTLVLVTSIPDEAIDALRELDWGRLQTGWLAWNAERREWQVRGIAQR